MTAVNTISSPAAAVAAAPEVQPSQEPLRLEAGKEGLEGMGIQCRLTVGAADDPLEREADAMADTVMRMPGQSFIQRKCAACEEEEQVQRKPAAGTIMRLPEQSFIQLKCAACEEEEPVQRKLAVGAVDDPLEREADAMADTVMRMPEQSFIQRKCAACEEEEVQRKPLMASVTPFIQAKGGDGGVTSDAVTSGINATRGGGSSMDKPTQSFMENRFGADFSNVKIHTGGYAADLSTQLNAQAFTVGSDIYFNSGKYNPSADSGKHLLAHELTHTIQQTGGVSAKRIQRKPGDVGAAEPSYTSRSLDENIGILFMNYANLAGKYGLGALEQVLAVSNTTASLYKVKYTEKGVEKTLIAEYVINPVASPQYFWVALPSNKFAMLGADDIELEDGTKLVRETLVTVTNGTAEAKKVYAEVDKIMTVPAWFTNDKDRADFESKVTQAGFAIVIMPSGGGGAAAKESSEGKKEVPPMPAWMKPYKTEMEQLIAAVKIAEPFSVDIPDRFFLYHSDTQLRWRAGASQAIPNSKDKVEVYFDIAEKDVKKEKLQEMRDKIRIKQLSSVADSTKKSNPLDPSLDWAYRLKLELDLLIAAEKKSFPSATDLPDKTAITTPPDNNKTAFLRLWLYVTRGDSEGNTSTELKVSDISSPLVKGTSPADLLVFVKKATLAMRGDMLKSVSNDPKQYAHVLEPFPAYITGLNTREDFRSVTGGKLELYMNLNMSAVAGMDLLSQTSTHFRGIYYTWDVYRISEVVPHAELSKMASDWKTKRKELQGWFKNSGQLKSANPALNEEMGMDLAVTLTPDELRTYRNTGMSYGQPTSLDAKGNLSMPMTEGEYVIYCRAVPEPGEDVIRMPSEAFFTVKLTDGYKMAEQIRDERLTDLEQLKKDLAAEKDENKKKKIQERIDAIGAQEKRTLRQSADYNITSQQDIAALAAKLRTYYVISGSKEVPEILVTELRNKKITDAEFDKLLDLWMYIETNDTSKKPVDLLTEMADSAKKNIKQLGELKERITMFEGDFAGYEILPAPVVGLVSRVTGQAYPLLLTIGVKETESGTEVLLADVTTHETQEKYSGSSSKKRSEGGLAAAVQEAFDSFGEECKYGEGFIAFRVPGTDAAGRSESAPGPWQQVKQVLGIVAAVAGIAALVVGTVFTGGALAVVAGYVGVGAMVIGAGLAAENIYDRAVNHRLHADVELAIDILNIAGPVLQGAGALAKLSKVSTLRTVVNAAEKAGDIATAERAAITVGAIAKLEKLVMLEKTLMILQKGEAITNLGLIGYKTYKDLVMIAEVYGDDPAKMRAMQAQIIKNAIISGTFALIALKNEFKMRNTDEIDGLVNGLIKEKDYEAAMFRSGMKDADGNWRDPKLKEYFLGKGKEEMDKLGKLPADEAAAGGTKPKPADAAAEKKDLEQHEAERKVDMTGHAKTPDKEHEVEAYPDGTVGRCSSTPGEKCPLLLLTFKDTIAERPVLKKRLDDMMLEIKAFGENVPKAKMDELAALEQRMRLLDTIRLTSSAPKNYKIREIADYNAEIDLPMLTEKTMIEYPGGERVWRGADNGIHHEGIIKPSIGRQGLEHDFYTGTETGLPTMKGTERAHSFGQGFGWESRFGLLNAPRFVNQKLQNNGIEQYVRTLRDLLPPGQQIVIHTNTFAVSGTRRLKSISYEGFILTASGEKIPAFSYNINVAWKPAGGSIVEALPIQFKTAANPAQQKILTDMQALIPAAKMPEWIVKPVIEDIK